MHSYEAADKQFEGFGQRLYSIEGYKVMKKRHFPKRNQRYVGFATDSSRWDHFTSRDDDIFICAPCKCGTTWTQAICALLIFKDPEHKKQPA